MTVNETCDVLVIGGGPGGSTVATCLAREGRRVIVLDKDRHPRFHIGESLLPAYVPLFDRLGVTDKIRAIGMPKYGVQFVSPHHDHVARLSFADAWDGSLSFSFIAFIHCLAVRLEGPPRSNCPSGCQICP